MKSVTWGATLLAMICASGADAGSFTIIDAPGAGKASGLGTYALSVNAGGTAAGWYLDKESNYHAFLRAPDGTYTTFQVNGEDTEIDAINDGGVATGESFNINAVTSIGFLRSARGKFTIIDPKNASLVSANAINRQGVVVGGEYTAQNTGAAFLWQKKKKLITFNVPGAAGTDADALNDSDTIAGTWSSKKNIAHGFVRSADGTITSFHAPGGGKFGADGTYVDAINAGGTTAGRVVNDIGNTIALVRDASGKITEFSAPGAGGGSAQGTMAYAIDRAGDITGSYIDSNYVAHGFVRSVDGAITSFDPPIPRRPRR